MGSGAQPRSFGASLFSASGVRSEPPTTPEPSEADALVSPRAGKKKKTGSPRSAIKLSDGGPSGRAHDVDGPGHGRAAVAAGVLLPAHVSPVAKVRNEIEWTVRTRVQLRRRP